MAEVESALEWLNTMHTEQHMEQQFQGSAPLGLALEKMGLTVLNQRLATLTPNFIVFGTIPPLK